MGFAPLGAHAAAERRPEIPNVGGLTGFGPFHPLANANDNRPPQAKPTKQTSAIRGWNGRGPTSDAGDWACRQIASEIRRYNLSGASGLNCSETPETSFLSNFPLVVCSI